MDGYFDYISLCNYILDPFYEIQFQSTTKLLYTYCIASTKKVWFLTRHPHTHKERSSSYSIILLHAAYLAYMYIPPLYLNYVKSLYRFLSRLPILLLFYIVLIFYGVHNNIKLFGSDTSPTRQLMQVKNAPIQYLISSAIGIFSQLGHS